MSDYRFPNLMLQPPSMFDEIVRDVARIKRPEESLFEWEQPNPDLHRNALTGTVTSNVEPGEDFTRYIFTKEIITVQPRPRPDAESHPSAKIIPERGPDWGAFS